MRQKPEILAARSASRVVLSEAQAAVDDYLDTLLFEATEARVPREIPAAAEVSPAVVVANAPAQEVCDVPQPVPAAEAAPRIEPVLEQPPSLDPQPEPEMVEEAAAAREPANQETEQRLPEWAETGFQCLQFDLGGWQLAAPLVGLQRILNRPGRMHRVPGAAPWEIGLCEHGEGKARVVNLSWLMGGSQKDDDGLSPDAHLLLLADGYWACLCDRIGEVSWLSATDIQWALRDERRPWEVGVVRDSLRTLVDPERLSQQLFRQVKRG